MLAALALGVLAAGVPQRHVTTELAIPVTVPTATHAETVPAWRFVGPLRVEGLAKERLCGETDRAALLREGWFGWRVLVITAEGLVGPDGSVAKGDWKALARAANAWRRRWAAVDDQVEVNCGVRPPEEVLIAVDREASTASLVTMTWAFGGVRRHPRGGFSESCESPFALLVAGDVAPRQIDVADDVAVMRLGCGPVFQVIGTAG